MWNSLEGNPGGGSMSSGAPSGISSMDPASLLMNTQLASALSLTGDAQYWEESISPTTIRQELSSADPSNPSSTPIILRGMKWLLASISKGRNVSDFYPHVVKLVGAVSLEVRKMVYMYLVQYANHDATTRELSLLSINAFQRGLADAEQWIRALALRVLTSILIPDILQIQILGVQKCAQDKSPYVRKCAANALAKLYQRCIHENQDDEEAAQQQQELLLQILQDLLWYDQATMVLTSALIAWQDMVPQRLDMLHGCFRKFCHLLTDMDEWGQVVVLDTFARYCRHFFAEPVNWRDGSAERIDRDRRVRRTIYGLESEQPLQQTNQHVISHNNSTSASESGMLLSTADQAAMAGVTLPTRKSETPKKIVRRVVKEAFYSDEEDESVEEEVYAASANSPALPVASAMRQRNVLGVNVNDAFVPRALQSSSDTPNNNNNTTNGMQQFSSPSQDFAKQLEEDPEESDLAEDHRLFLNAAMHLLKSRNAGVVMGVCSLQYYCGVSSIKVRAAMGKALVRIHRDLREIQYVVLSSIRTLASECPSAFSPFLSDFFVKSSLDPPFTRMIKLDILTSLALEPAAIDAVLREMRSYVRHNDTQFARAAIRAVGRVVELARIVYDRHATKTNTEQRSEANNIALNALSGLLTLTQVQQSNDKSVVGETVLVMRSILQLLGEDGNAVHDANRVQERSVQRVLLLLMKTWTARIPPPESDRDEEDDEEDEEDNTATTALDAVASVELPEEAAAVATWVVGEYLSDFSLSPSVKPFREEASRSRIRLEMMRMLVKAYPDLSAVEKEQGIHFSSKLIVSRLAGGAIQAQTGESALCEQVLSMGRVDVNPDVRDRARFESSLLRTISALEHDLDGMDVEGALAMSDKSLSLDNVKRILLQKKPLPSSLPVENHSNTHALQSDGFRFGTLSSLVGHRARSAYIPLPAWAEGDSPSSLRDAPQQKKPKQLAPHATTNDAAQSKQKMGGFYDEESGSTDGSSSSSESSDDSSSSSNSSSDDDDSSDDSSVDAPPVAQPHASASAQHPAPSFQQPKVQTITNSDSDSDDSSDDSDDSSSDEDDQKPAGHPAASANNLISTTDNLQHKSAQLNGSATTSKSSVADDMKGLVLAPVVTDANQKRGDADIERDSSNWTQLVRPEHTGGLSVKARYLFGPTRDREAELLGAKAEKPTLVLLQLLLESTPTASSVFRRVKWMPKHVSGSTIGPKKTFFPPEIDQLKPGQKSECVLGMDFATPSDRDGTLLAKFDFKFGSGGIPVEIKPTLGDVLLPCQKTENEFESEMRRLHGFQRVETTVEGVNSYPDLLKTLSKSAALTIIGKADFSVDDSIRLVGTLPASGDAVLVKVTRGDACKMTVCSDNALAANSLMNVLKKKIQSSLKK